MTTIKCSVVPTTTVPAYLPSSKLNENMDDLNKLLRYQLKYLYNVEVQAESFFHRLRSKVYSKELIDRIMELEKEAQSKKKRIDTMCRNFFIDPRGFYSKSMMGFVEDIDFLLQSSFSSDVKESAVNVEISKILRYQKELYDNLLTLAEELEWYDLSKEISMVLKLSTDEVEVESNGSRNY